MEPLDGHPNELREFVEQHLEAPFEGTVEAKKAVTQSIFEIFPEMEVAAKKKAERARAREAAEAAAAAAESPEADTPDPYHPDVADAASLLDDAHAALRAAGIHVPEDGSMDISVTRMLMDRLGMDSSGLGAP